MKLYKNIFFALAIITLALSGCGSATSSKDSANGDRNLHQPAAEKKNQNKDSNSPNKDEDTNKEATDDGVVRILEQNIQYKVNGETKKETAFLKYNDTKDYSMYVLPEYKLTAEEPSKDVLYLTDNPEIFMRIELIPKDTNWDAITNTTKAQLQAVSNDIKTLQAPKDSMFKNSIVMEASKNGETVTAYLINNPDLPLKLTMYTKEDADHRDAFLQMAKTIMKEKKSK
ncbi:hypothetical protein C0971_05410 [Bacillus methanolicus]|uniref:hypothetical protein n=1 Tax=Bacillus methanolicus TaxID=1471 RepID=UPI00200F77A5|nr:hypothetical protein [Bacillus methanolicus]UQD51520.1 hypothetical protein C0971_05410 [Bacillus methanolicus]